VGVHYDDDDDDDVVLVVPVIILSEQSGFGHLFRSNISIL